MDYADRVTDVVRSPEFSVADRVARLEQAGDDVIDLSVGQPDREPPGPIVEATVTALTEGKTGYTATQGIPSLRRAIVNEKLSGRNDLSYDTDEVLVTPGARMAFYLAIQAFIEDGDEVILFNPFFTSFDSAVEIAGGRVRRVDLTPYTFQLEPALDDLAAAISSETKMVILNTPSNPSGMVFSEAALRGLRDLALDHDLVVVADEIYDELTYDADPTSIAALSGMADRTITVNGFSKTFGMTGYRLGYMAAPTPVIDHASTVYSHSVSCLPEFVQMAGVAALTEVDVDALTASMMDTYRERLEALATALEPTGVEFPWPDGTFYVMLPVAGDDVDWAERAIEEAGVAVVPGTAFGSEGYVRIALVEPPERIEAAVERLRTVSLL